MTSPPVKGRADARWVFPPPPDPGEVAALAAALTLPEPICRLLIARGYRDPERAKTFLRPRLDQMHDPLLLRGMDQAVDRLVRAIRAKERIMIHGDYDVDGISSVSLLLRAIEYFGGDAVPFIPRRLEDGYDLGMAGVRAAVDAGAKVLVTCDCGTSACVPVKALCEAGIDVIISDHHLPSGPLPECLAVINPRQPGCEYPDKDLAAVGIAFKIALAIARALGVSENPILRMLDLVALATVADIAPLRGENRVLVRYGLRMIAESDNVGLRALIRAAGLEHKAINAGRIGFILAPRLNAIGRLAHALLGVELLTTRDEHRANAIARELEETNRRRQEIDRATEQQARDRVDEMDLEGIFGIVLADAAWHPGVIGIVASRIVEETGRPTILVALHQGEGKGSGRSISAFDLHAGLTACRDLLVRYGGHRAAAGITVREEKLDEFRMRFNEVAKSRLSPEDLVPEIRVDLELPLSAARLDFDKLLQHFEPFGVGNPAPVFVVRGAKIAAPPRIVGDGHLKLRLGDQNAELDAIGFGMAKDAPPLEPGTAVDAAFRLERDTFNGEDRLQAKLVGIRLANGA